MPLGMQRPLQRSLEARSVVVEKDQVEPEAIAWNRLHGRNEMEGQEEQALEVRFRFAASFPIATWNGVGRAGSGTVQVWTRRITPLGARGGRRSSTRMPQPERVRTRSSIVSLPTLATSVTV